MPNELPRPRLIRQPLQIAYLIGDPPPPVDFHAGGVMHPESITTLYGAGGIGKGWVAAWVYRELVNEGYNPLILDFEGVIGEWWRRLRWMGFREPIQYYEAERRLTVPMAGDIVETVRQEAITHIILDSASTARSRPTDNDSGGGDATVDMFKGMKSFGCPVLLLAHEPKNGEGPIGSIHFQSQSRLMWRARAVPNGTELRMTKANDVVMSDTPLTFYRVPTPDGGVDVVREWAGAAKVEAETLPSAIMRVMRERDRLMSPTDVQVILTREGMTVSLPLVTTTMGKLLAAKKLARPERGRYNLPTPDLPSL